MTLDPRAISPKRRVALAATLPGHINLLGSQRGAEVPAEDLADYVTLGWMRWAAGRVLITPTGAAARDAELDEPPRQGA